MFGLKPLWGSYAWRFNPQIFGARFTFSAHFHAYNSQKMFGLKPLWGSYAWRFNPQIFGARFTFSSHFHAYNSQKMFGLNTFGILIHPILIHKHFWVDAHSAFIFMRIILKKCLGFTPLGVLMHRILIHKHFWVDAHSEFNFMDIILKKNVWVEHLWDSYARCFNPQTFLG
jgi:hypothetical protein